MTVTTRRVVVSLLIILVAGGIAGGLAQLRFETTAKSFLPEGDPAVAALKEHERSFGGSPVVAVLESPQPMQLLVGDKQLQKLMRLEGRLSRLPDVATVYGPGTITNQFAITMQDMIVRLSGMRDGLRARAENKARQRQLTEAEIRSAGDKATEKFDKRYGALLVKGLPAGLPTTSNPSFVKNVVYDQDGTPRPRWHFVVPTPNSVVVLIRPREGLDEAGAQRLVSAVQDAVGTAGLATKRVTVTGVPAVTAALTDQAAKEIPLLGGLALIVILLRFLFAPSYLGWWRKVGPLLAAVIGSAMTLAVFGWFGIALSLGAVVLLPLLLGIGSAFPLYLITSARRRRVITVALASATAFASLAVSPMPFVRELGVALALGVLFTVAATVVLGRLFPFRGSADPRSPDTAAGSAPVRARWLLLSCLVGLAAAGWAVLPKLDVQANPEDIARGLPQLEQARHAEQVLGSSGDFSVVLRGNDVQSPRALSWLSDAEDRVISRFGDQVRPILTAPDLLKFLGPSPTPQQVSSGLQTLPPYLVGAVFGPDGRQALLTFGLSFQDMGQQARLLRDIRSALPPPPPGTHADVVGLPVAASHAYERISAERYIASVIGIVAAGAVLLLGLRSRREALLAMLAAALATGWTIAGLWVVGQSLSPLTVALGSLATVTACEFTVLLADGSRQRAARLRRMVGWACATSAVGYLALVPSKIGLLREFGIVLAVAVLFSYLAAAAVVSLCARREREPADASRSDHEAVDRPLEVYS